MSREKVAFGLHPDPEITLARIALGNAKNKLKNCYGKLVPKSKYNICVNYGLSSRERAAYHKSVSATYSSLRNVDVQATQASVSASRPALISLTLSGLSP